MRASLPEVQTVSEPRGRGKFGTAQSARGPSPGPSGSRIPEPQTGIAESPSIFVNEEQKNISKMYIWLNEGKRIKAKLTVIVEDDYSNPIIGDLSINGGDFDRRDFSSSDFLTFPIISNLLPNITKHINYKKVLSDYQKNHLFTQ